jgi:DNA-binding FrmR family transcriptional regulator
MLDQKIKEQELRISNIETKTNALQEEAKAKLKQGDKAGAKRILAKKKKYVDQIKQIEGAMAMMEEQKMMLESAISTKDMMNAIKAGTAAVKDATKGISVEDLENMKEDMENIKADQEELNDFFKDYADQEQEGVDEELEQLEEQMAKEEAGAMPEINKENLGPVPAEKNKEEEDLSNFLAV